LRTSDRTGPDPTGGSEGPGQRLLARPRVGRGQGQLLVDRPWGVGPGPDPDPTYFLCEINAVFLMSVALLSVVKKLKELSNISSYNSASGTNSNFAESKLRPNKKISNTSTCPVNATVRTHILLSKVHVVYNHQNGVWEMIIPLLLWRSSRKETKVSE